jgi:electron transfer flavoprotein alpha subunit
MILVFAEATEAGLKKSSLELLTAAHKSGLKVTATIFGPHAKMASAALQKWADHIILASSAQFANYNSELYVATLAEIISKTQPQILLASSNSLGRDLFPRVAARVGGACASDCTELSISADGKILARRPLYAGKVTAEVEFKDTKVKIVLMRPNQIPVDANGSKNGTVEEFEAPARDLMTMVKEVVKGTSSRLDLSEANIIVSGGRGMKDAASFKLLEDLAETIGATVGASRAVVDAGWVSHSMQVGQTGKTVAPSLYIACGISGAIQHLAGMSGSKVIVAINKDANAPIFQKATYGIVGDVFEVVPLLTQEFKKLLSH